MKNGFRPDWLLFLLTAVAVNVGAEEPVTLIEKDSASTLIKRKSIVIVRKRTEREESKGINLGNYVFLPRVNVAEYYDDNVFVTESDPQSDMVTVFIPAFNLKSAWQQHDFNVDAGIEAMRHADLATENTTNAWLSMDGEYDLSEGSQFSAGFSYTQDHEDRGSPDAETGANPTEFDDQSASAGYAGRKGNQYWKLTIDARRLDFKDVDSPSGPIDYDDRDRDEDSLGLRYLFKHSPTLAFFIDTQTDRREYRQALDNEGNDRKSDGYRYALGLERAGPKVVARIFIGKLNRDYRNIDFNDADESDFGFQLRWKVYPDSTLIARSSRSIEETTLDASPGYLLQTTQLRLSINLSEEKSLAFYLIKSEADYEGIARLDDYTNVGVAYSQQIFSSLKFGLDLHRAERDSNIVGDDFRVNQLFFRIMAAI